jgi:hypothetical protein
MNNALMFATGNDITGTDPKFFAEMVMEFGPFVCDVAALLSNRKVEEYFGPDHVDPCRQDCLTIDWPTHGPCWMNPPYSKAEEACVLITKRGLPKACKKKACAQRGFHISVRKPGCYDFVMKAAEQRLRGATTVALLAARTDNDWFHDFIYDRHVWDWREGVSCRLLPGRQVFEGHEDSAPFPSMVVIFRP